MTLSGKTEKTEASAADEPNKVFCSEEWMDGHPILDGRFALDQASLVHLDSLMTDGWPQESRLRRANRHFREALHLLDIDPHSSGDVATALLISALEG